MHYLRQLKALTSGGDCVYMSCAYMSSVSSQVSHEFPINFNPSNPFCNGKSEKVRVSDLDNKMPKVKA